MGNRGLTQRRPAFYARTGTPARDLGALLHWPYTLWHLSYVVIGASLASELDWPVLLGTLLAFLFGLGLGAHSLDELRGRPLGTGISDRTLILIAVVGLAGPAAIAVVGAAVVSPWLLLVALVGVTAAVVYPLELIPRVHSDVGFALLWGSFPVLVGYWAQTLSVSIAAGGFAVVALLLSLVQRRLSTPARYVRRHTSRAVVEFDRAAWGRAELLSTWELPLMFLGWAVTGLAVSLLLTHI